MDTVRLAPLPSVGWDEALGVGNVAPEAVEVLACMYRFAAYDSEMSFKLCGHRWDEDEYEETLHVQIFRKHLTSLGQEFFERYWHLKPRTLVSCLSVEDIERFRSCLTQAWDELQQLPSPVQVNKRLYDEMLRTRRMVETYLNDLRSRRKRLRPIPPLILGFDRETRGELQAREVKGFSTSTVRTFPQEHLDLRATASGFVAHIKRTQPGEVRGHLLWVTHHADGTPQCVLLLFVEGSSQLQVRSLQRLWADYIVGQHPDFHFNDVVGIGCKAEIALSLDGDHAETWDRLTRWMMKMFVEPLRYQRLKLPPKARGWAKGVL